MSKNDLYEKVELLNSVGTKPHEIAKVLKIDINKVNPIIKSIAQEIEKRELARIEEENKKRKMSKYRTKRLGMLEELDDLKDDDVVEVTHKLRGLKKEQIIKMRMLRSRGYSVYSVAGAMGMAANDVVPYIKDIKPNKNPDLRAERTKLTEYELKEMPVLQSNGLTVDEIARLFRVSEICIVNNLKKSK